MLKATPLLILFVFATSSVLSQGIGGSIGGSGGLSANGHISISPFDPVGFANLILNIIRLPFRRLGGTFGGLVGIGPGSNGLTTTGNISNSPFNPIGFTKLMVYMISLPFRFIGHISGGGMFGSSRSGNTDGSSGTEAAESRGGGGIFGTILEIPRGVARFIEGIPRGIARFIEEFFHFMRLFHDRIYWDLETGAAYIAGNGPRSTKNREIRSDNVTAESTQAIRS